MDSYFYWCGVGVNVIAAIGFAMFIWVCFVWPFVEAASITMVFVMAARKSAVKISLWIGVKQFFRWYGEFLFGREATCVSNKYARWEGVGKWVIYSEQGDYQ